MRHKWKRMFLALICVNLFSVMLMWTYLLDRQCPCFQEEPAAPAAQPASPPRERRQRARKPGLIKSPDASSLEDDAAGRNVAVRSPLDNIYDLPNRLLTLVFREFEYYEHDLIESVRSFHTVFPRMPIVVLADGVPYPPIRFPVDEFGTNVSVVSLARDPSQPANATELSSYVKTDMVMFAPDSVRMTQPAIVTKMVRHVYKHPGDMVAVRVAGEKRHCLLVDVNLREWTLVYRKAARKAESRCDAFAERHLLLAKSSLVLGLSGPMLRPFPEAMQIQTALRGVKIHIIDDYVVQNGRTLFPTSHHRDKLRAATAARLAQLYADFGIKKVHLPGGEVEWHGCDRSTPRCFGTVVDETPDYLYRGRWTPPCCLENLRRTARHVFSILERCKVRYWLEGGSLLGAARNHDIIPWDYDVDVGIYAEDAEGCEWLRNARRQSIVDADGFVWEKAVEGEFFRVQYSRANRVHVDIFPFRSKEGGIMTKDTWFPTHPQDCEFPERFLKPLTTILFVGVFASAPNNVTEFLEFKFGKGVLKKPQYPNPSLLAYPKAR